MQANVPISRTAIAAFRRQHEIRRQAIFGSALREDFRPDSDIDLLVRFQPDQIPSLFGMARLERELSPLFGGRKVDLRTPEDLRGCFRQTVIDEADVQYGLLRYHHQRDNWGKDATHRFDVDPHFPRTYNQDHGN